MANIKSQKKRNITNEKARQRNRSVRAALKTAAKKVHAAVDAGDKDTAIAAAQAACRELDRAVTKGVIHKNQAANRKSGLMKLANRADGEGAAVAAPVAKKAAAKKAEAAEEAPKPKKAPARKAAPKKAKAEEPVEEAEEAAAEVEPEAEAEAEAAVEDAEE